jgi:hypothetical protein
LLAVALTDNVHACRGRIRKISIHIHIDESLARRARAVKGFLRRPAVLITSVLLLVAIPLSLRAAPVTIPNQFAAGSPASAATSTPTSKPWQRR